MEFSERFQFFKEELDRLVFVDIFEKPYGISVIHYAFEENGPIVAVFEGITNKPEDEVQGLMHMGNLTFTNGMSYDGTWYEDLPDQGFYNGDGGRFEFEDGIVFVGNVHEGLPNGFGWIHLPNGESIWADWYDGVPRNATRFDSNGKELVEKTSVEELLVQEPMEEEPLEDEVEDQDLEDAWQNVEYKSLYEPEEYEYEELYAPEQVTGSGRVEACQEMNQRIGSMAVSTLRCRLGKKTARKTKRNNRISKKVRKSKKRTSMKQKKHRR